MNRLTTGQASKNNKIDFTLTILAKEVNQSVNLLVCEAIIGEPIIF
jgi:hypothetical protein